MPEVVVDILNEYAARREVEEISEPEYTDEVKEVPVIDMVAADPNVDLEPGYELIEQEEIDTAGDVDVEAGEGVKWVGDEYLETEFGEALEAYMNGNSEEGEGDPGPEEIFDSTTKVTRSGKVYITKIKRMVLSASTKRISMKKAMGLYKQKALDSMFGELSVLNEKWTFHPVNPNELTKGELKKMIRSFMFLTEKYDADGNFIKLKSRLVAMGNQQDIEMIETDVSSSTVSITSIYTIVAIAAVEGREVMTLDIGGAFLNALIPSGEQILVRLDDVNSELLCQLRPEYRIFLTKSNELVVRLDKALYRCVQSARLWYNTFKEYVMSVGYVPNEKYMCAFNKTTDDGHQSTLCFHVDDVMITSRDVRELDLFERLTKERFENVTINRGKKHSYLGRMFDFTKDFTCEISMTGYVDRLIADEGVSGTVASPATDNLFKTNKDAKKLSENDAKRYYSSVQRLLYLAVQFRRDILLAISFLTTRVRSPDENDLKKLKRVIMYLNGTRDLFLVFKGDGSRKLVLNASIDASFGTHVDGKSHSGYTAMIGGGAVDAKSKKQSLNTKSSTEAEMVALSDMASLAIRWREFLIAQGYEIGALEIEQDNTSCIKLVQTGKSFNPMSRHINIRYFFVKDRIDCGEIKLKYVKTEEMVSDILTKPLQGERFRYLRSKLMNHVL